MVDYSHFILGISKGTIASRSISRGQGHSLLFRGCTRVGLLLDLGVTDLGVVVGVVVPLLLLLTSPATPFCCCCPCFPSCVRAGKAWAEMLEGLLIDPLSDAFDEIFDDASLGISGNDPNLCATRPSGSK